MNLVPQNMQLVILAGGRGERLSPLTDVMPKPLTVFHGKTFLEHQIEHYYNIGFINILVLLGYKSDIFNPLISIFESKYRSLNIKFVPQSEELTTALRLTEARDLMLEQICVIYGDTLVRLTADESKKHFQNISEGTIKFVAYRGKGYSNKKNLKIKSERIEYFNDRSESCTDLNLGVFVTQRDLLLGKLNYNQNLELAIFESSSELLLPTQTTQKYYSLTDHSRLPSLERYLDPKRVIVFLDRDGTINQKAEKARYILQVNEFKWKRYVRSLFSSFLFRKVEFFVVTNQPGVGKQVLSKETADDINSFLFKYSLNKKNRIKAIFVCYHDWNDGCDCRKPRPGLIYQAQEIFDINLRNSIYFGDDDRDGLASDSAGVKFIKIPSEGGNLTYNVAKWLFKHKIMQIGGFR